MSNNGNLETQITPEIGVVALGDNEASGDFFAILSFVDLDGKRRRIQVPASELDNRRALTARLRNAGAYFSEKERVNERAFRELSKSRARAKRWTFAKSVGWRDGQRRFVTAHKIIGAKSPEIKIKPPAVPALLSCTTGGTLKKWQEEVASGVVLKSLSVCDLRGVGRSSRPIRESPIVWSLDF